MDNDINEDFSGVFMFTNPTKKERKYLWNNKEYIFPPESTVPLIIPTETLENIQEIRKRFAFRMAEERLYEGEVASNGFNYMKAKEEGRGMPPTFDNKILEPWIHECLKPLPIKRASIQKGKELDNEKNYKATKAMGSGLGGQPAEEPTQIFTESENRYAIGAQPDR
jgi:hypothetical protein